MKLQEKWKQTSNKAVYESIKGKRIHMFGLIRINDVTHIIGCLDPLYEKAMRMFGYNRRRALMYMAEKGEVI